MKLRRIVAVILVILGGALWALAPETVGGATLIVVGLIIEIVGITLEKKR